MTAHPAQDSEPAGVFQPTGLDGYVTLIVRGRGGRLLLRIEIASDCYSTAWVVWLERWARRWDVGFMQLLK